MFTAKIVNDSVILTFDSGETITWSGDTGCHNLNLHLHRSLDRWLNDVEKRQSVLAKLKAGLPGVPEGDKTDVVIQALENLGYTIERLKGKGMAGRANLLTGLEIPKKDLEKALDAIIKLGCSIEDQPLIFETVGKYGLDRVVKGFRIRLPV